MTAMIKQVIKSPKQQPRQIIVYLLKREFKILENIVHHEIILKLFKFQISCATSRKVVARCRVKRPKESENSWPSNHPPINI